MSKIDDAKSEYQAALKTAYAALQRRNDISQQANESSKHYAETTESAKKKRMALIALIDEEAKVPSHVVPDLAV